MTTATKPPQQQQSAIKELPRPRRIIDAEFRTFNALVYGMPGVGKCLGRDTPVLMFDGTIKAVQDIQAGERLMGPDSTPRTVLSTTAGVDNLYRVVPTKGEAYIVNEPHILSLKRTGTDRIVDISVRDYLQATPCFRDKMKGYRVGVEFPSQPVTLDPYFLGVWLGDGTATCPEVTNPDQEVVSFLYDYAETIGLQVSKKESDDRETTYRIHSGRNNLPNPILDELRTMGLIQNKHIPIAYRCNGRKERLRVLAGIIDADGHLEHNCYDLVFKPKQLADDVVYVARSLGLAAYVKPCTKCCTTTGASGTYYRITISGDIDSIPVRVARKKATTRQQIKDVLVTGISVEHIGEGEYFGFEIDGDRRFLLGDFTVTHNTLLGATGPAPVLFVDIDQGLRSLNNPDPKLTAALGINLAQLYFEPVRSLTGIMALYKRLTQEFAQEPERYRTIVLDNLTELQRCLMREYLDRERERENKNIPAARLQDHGAILSQMQQVVMAFKGLPANVIFIAHEGQRDNMIGPSLTGKMLEELPGYVDAVFRYTLIAHDIVDQGTGEKSTRVLRYLRTRPMPPAGEDPGIIAKHRGDRLNEREEPHLGRLLEKINAKDKVAA